MLLEITKKMTGKVYESVSGLPGGEFGMNVTKTGIILILLISFIAGIPCVSAASDELSVQLTKLPLSFIENQGQKQSPVLFHVEAAGHSIYFTPDEVVLAASDPVADLSSVIRISIRGSDPDVRVEGVDQLPGTANFFTGSDPSKWKANVPTYGAVAYRDVLPGTDLVFSGTEGFLKREFVLSPGADPRSIVMKYQGAESLSVDDDGNLLVGTPLGTLYEAAPVSYQIIGGERVDVYSRYILLEEDQVGFEVGTYNQEYPLVIDPELDYSTYLGGSNEDRGYSVAVDSAGSAYITGFTKSTDFPLPLAMVYQDLLAGGSDAFVTKLTPDGTQLVYSTYLGGSADDVGTGIVVDDYNNATLTGYTLSCDFPVWEAVQYNKSSCYGSDAFVTRIWDNGSALVFSTYLGGCGDDAGLALALTNSAVNVDTFVTGYTFSSDFPNTSAFQPNLSGGSDAFVTDIRYTGTGNATIPFSTFLGGDQNDQGKSIALDASGNIFVTGTTRSSNFPTQSAFRPNIRGTRDAFVTKMNPTASALFYSTYLGGLGDEEGNGIAVDSAGDAYVTGMTQSSNFPVTLNAFQSLRKGIQDAFVTKFTNSGTALNYSTYLGGGGLESGSGIVVDSAGTAYIAGYTDSIDYPVANAIYPNRNGFQYDAFLTRMSVNGSQLVFSTYLGGTYADQAMGIAKDSGANITMTGWTQSRNFPVKNAFQPAYAGPFDAFVARIMQQPPVANFTGQPLKGLPPLAVQFNDTSTGSPTTWSWLFGDGNTSSVQNPAHIYMSPGNYTVNLTVSNIDGSNTTGKFEYIHVGVPLITDFIADVRSGMIPLTVNFTDMTNDTPIAWNWSFGDGSWNNTAQNVTYTYTNAGYYNVSLNATNDYGSNTTTKYQYILAGDIPAANFTGSPQNGTAPLFVSFLDNSTSIPPALNWTWDFGDGNTTVLTGGGNVGHTYTAEGNYTVNLTVWNIFGSNTSSLFEFISVGEVPVANFTATPVSGAEPLAVNFTDFSTGTPALWNWSFGDGNTTSYTTNATFDHTYSNAGNYTVDLTVSNMYGSNTMERFRYIRVYGNVSIVNLTFVPSTVTIPTNSTTAGSLILEKAEQGLAGYNITVFFDNPTAANFVVLTPPAWSDPSFTVNSSIPASSFWLKILDNANAVKPGDTNIELARFNSTGVTPMSTMLNVTVTQMDTDTGDAVVTNNVPAQVTVVALLNLPGEALPPTDPFHDGVYWDLNGNGRIDFNDVVLYFNYLEWMQANEPVSLFDYNNNGRIDFNDLILLFNML
jgi:PKD repeat protein